MLERFINFLTDPESKVPPATYQDNFRGLDMRAARSMEDEYIRLGYMTDADRVQVPDAVKSEVLYDDPYEATQDGSSNAVPTPEA